MRASPRVSEEGADLVGRLRGKNVLEFARLLLDFCLAVHGEAVREQPLRQAMTANDIGSPLPPAWSELHNHAAIANRDGIRLQGIMAGVHERLMIVPLRRMGSTFYAFVMFGNSRGPTTRIA